MLNLPDGPTPVAKQASPVISKLPAIVNRRPHAVKRKMATKYDGSSTSLVIDSVGSIGQ